MFKGNIHLFHIYKEQNPSEIKKKNCLLHQNDIPVIQNEQRN